MTSDPEQSLEGFDIEHPIVDDDLDSIDDNVSPDEERRVTESVDDEELTDESINDLDLP